jgi:tRNA A-37 threonylcarbamoyl transferase component Bud32
MTEDFQPPAPRPRAELRKKSTKDDIITVRYRPLSELEKWLSQRVDDRSNKKTAYVTVTVVLFLMFGAPTLLFLLTVLMRYLQSLGGGAGSGGLEQVVADNISFLIYFGLSAMGITAAAAAYYNSLPTHLQLTDQGLKLLWRHKFLTKDGDTVPWNQISNIGLELPPGKNSPLDHIVRFDYGPAKALKLRLGAIPSAEERANILKGVEQFAPTLQRDAQVVEALELPPDHSYTELWLQALSGPPKRERLKPLEEKARLRDGRYTVHHALGVGGQGTAYLATDHAAMDESVVLKEFILPVYVDVNVRRQSLERFEKEARILKQLDHDQVVKLIDFFLEDHRGYLVLEHIDGASLRDLVLKEGPLSESRVRELAAQMCTIQHYLHELSPPVVHRDFTPDNLILRKDGKLKLVDFNVAQQTESTATGTVVGKHAYLPPEQFRGQPVTQSDIYALGASLYFILTGEDPDPISVLHPKKVKPELSNEIDAIVARATAIELKDRYAHSLDVEKDLLASGVAGVASSGDA